MLNIDDQLEALKREFEEKKAALLEPVRDRIRDIRNQIAELEAEERKLRAALNLPAAGSAPKATRRSSGRRMSAEAKKEVLKRFVAEGHIRNNMELSKELRTALADEGLMPYDFPKIKDLLPEGWTAESNGQRGLSAKTVFYQR